MNEKITRRAGIKFAAAGTLISLVPNEQSSAIAVDIVDSIDPWARAYDRVWLGGEYWANPMEDWRIVAGTAECQNAGENRSIHSLTHQISNLSGDFAMTVHLERVEAVEGKWSAGFRLGVRSEINEHRSNCFASNGLDAGIKDGQLVLGPKSSPLNSALPTSGIDLKVVGHAVGDKQSLTLQARSTTTGAVLGEVTHQLLAANLLGNVALVSNYSSSNKRGPARSGPRYRFSNWQMTGDAFTTNPSHRFGPILWAMYSLSDSRSDEGFVMKLSALTGPMGTDDSQVVELHAHRDQEWQSLGNGTLDPDAWIATFRIPNWDETRATTYKLVYRERHRDGSESLDEWIGIIKPNPMGRPLRLAAMTCQNDYAFPYEPVVNNVAKLDPDLVYFSGDQIYENHGGFGIVRDPAASAILNYLRKFYQFGWSFREVMRNRPTLCLPDDHDVFQGNIWGEGGAAMVDGDGGASSKGGYRQSARMVNAVHKTNVSHHPDPFDPTPSTQDISVYYGELIYGAVSFAIIADRQWKSGPERVDTGSGRADHVLDEEFDCLSLDRPGLVLLGERQEAFLKLWATDWRQHTLKVMLSQTVFAGIATHHGKYDGYLKADLDSGAWPQTPRNRAIDILRPSMALHINGDQHLTSLTQYGVAAQRDSNWSFCTPAIAAGYPRWWRPDELGIPHAARPTHGLPNTGEFVDSFGNKVYVYAIGNPEVGTKLNRYEKAHQKGSGFGLVTLDTTNRQYIIQSFRFLVDAADGKPSNQFPGWPVTIQQAENKGQNIIG